MRIVHKVTPGLDRPQADAPWSVDAEAQCLGRPVLLCGPEDWVQRTARRLARGLTKEAK